VLLLASLLACEDRPWVTTAPQVALHPPASTTCEQVDCDADGDGSNAVAFGGTDCDDDNRQIHVAADEVCNGVDDDCDGLTDDADPTVDLRTARHWWPDADGDGYGADPPVARCDAPPETADDGTDCDDGNPGDHPDAPEMCNAFDDDSDFLIDDADSDVEDPAIYHADDDGDGYGDPLVVLAACVPPDGYVLDATDCEPADPERHAPTVFWPDLDLDGAGDPAGPSLAACVPPAAYAAVADDCDDTDPEQVPGAVWYRDGDADGFGDPGFWVAQCLRPAAYLPDATDCDDLDAFTHPGAPEPCGEGDRDCDGLFPDTAFSRPTTLVEQVTDVGFVADLDGDGLDDLVWSDRGGLALAWSPGFAVPSAVIDEAAAWALAPADLDGDGGLDLVVALADDDAVVWYPNLLDGTFGEPLTVGSGVDVVRRPAVADLDLDGDLDVVVGTTDGRVVAFANLGAGFDGGTDLAQLTGLAGDVATGDVDGDGDPDVLATPTDPARLTWQENLGDGTFDAPVDLALTEATADHVLATADVEGDGDLDLVGLEAVQSRLTVYTNDGGGVFTATQVLDTAPGTAALVLADLDGDGDPDLLLGSDDPGVESSGVLVWHADTDGLFGAGRRVAESTRVGWLATGDVDQDGDADVVGAIAATAVPDEVAWFSAEVCGP
jgi:hypothetical protein